MRRQPFASIRRYDGFYWVWVRMDGLEHTLNHQFRRHSDASVILRQVKVRFAQGGDLNLKHWETEAAR